MAMKRSGKFYRRNEAEVMEQLGFKPTINSGSGWIEKEDGQNENAICQLKSTDAQSIKINLKDIHTLEYNASVTNKLPVFAIQFLSTQETYLVLKPELLEDIVKYIKTGSYVNNSIVDINLEEHEELEVQEKKIKSSSNARLRFMQENENKFKKERKSAK